jgi:protein-tyrosine-phosphatase
MKQVALVCHGNIARSQVLHHFLELHNPGDVTFFSCGTASENAYADVERLLEDVSNALQKRGVTPNVERRHWDEMVCMDLCGADVILAADASVRSDLRDRLPIAPEKVQLFYEFAGEGEKDFVDTYDHEKGMQDAGRFDACFTELERIALLIASRL